MNKSLATFLGIAITVLAISAFLFFMAYNMIGSEANQYKTEIESMSNNLP